MFDKITIKSPVSHVDSMRLASLHHLQEWTSEDGIQYEYRSGQHSKFSGIEVRIAKNIVTLKTSLHKYWSSRCYGTLRNDNVFTVSEAKLAFEMFLAENGLSYDKTKITQFELGLNMNVSFDPLSFIEQVQYIPRKNNKHMFVDANYRINRQKTSEKHKFIRKYYKIYDKGWEMKEKNRDSSQAGNEPEKILRIESVHKRCNLFADKFFTDRHIDQLVTRFYKDWKDLSFIRSVSAPRGTRRSEMERARQIVNLGAKEYLQRSKDEFDNGQLTRNQFRTIREFVRDFEGKKGHHFKELISPQEEEFKSLIYPVYNLSRQ